jgi:hypothetical protein
MFLRLQMVLKSFDAAVEQLISWFILPVFSAPVPVCSIQKLLPDSVQCSGRHFSDLNYFMGFVGLDKRELVTSFQIKRHPKHRHQEINNKTKHNMEL